MYLNKERHRLERKKSSNKSKLLKNTKSVKNILFREENILETIKFLRNNSIYTLLLKFNQLKKARYYREENYTKNR